MHNELAKTVILAESIEIDDGVFEISGPSFKACESLVQWKCIREILDLDEIIDDVYELACKYDIQDLQARL